MYDSAGWYDRTINWEARLQREIPVLVEIFGPPGEGGILDAGCGNGRQATALSQRGYKVVGADASADMLRFAMQFAESAKADIRCIQTSYGSLVRDCGNEFNGVYCIGNSLAAAGNAATVAKAIEQFASCLRIGGRLFVQILNFAPMRKEVPCVRGPRIATVDEREYVSVRQFHFVDHEALVTNISIWKDGQWKQRSHAGCLYSIEHDELLKLCEKAGLRVDAIWGSYAKEPFDLNNSVDLILVATRS